MPFLNVMYAICMSDHASIPYIRCGSLSVLYIVCNTLEGKKGLSLFKIPNVLDILCVTLLM